MEKRSLQSKELSVLHRIAASSVGGIATALIMTPLDVVKIRMQSHRMFAGNKCFIYCNGLMEHLCTCSAGSTGSKLVPWYEKPGTFVGTWVGFRSPRHSDLRSSCVYHSGHPSSAVLSRRSMRLSDAVFKIVRNEGVWSLWSGLSPTLVMALPQTVIYFTVNDVLKEKVGYSSFQLAAATQKHGLFTFNDWTPAFIGGISRVFAVTAISPLELLRTKMQAVRMTPDRLKNTLLVAIKQGGLQSLWTGMGPTLLRDVPYSMFFWLVFDYLKSHYLIGRIFQTDLYSSQCARLPDLSFYRAFLYGAVAGLTAGVLTHPFDVIKTHRQVELGEALVMGRPYPKSTLASLHRLYNAHGIRAVFAGFTPRLLKTTNASAIMIATFETFKGYFANPLESV
ncbi:solute carrier family 25, member 39/40 [Paragonimus westermani]|uniref:Solute carrier family 25, member 39/40 n=1 Tax=Paragonimus westermani TaxID=34504 RepID=A0A5J4NK16_9TREM|nr:solute carrier family 25, member 39/40 [Paragonimus westermani]